MVIRDCYGEPGAVPGSGTSGTPVSGDFAVGCEGGGAALSPADAAGAVLSRWQAVFCVGAGNGNYHGAAGAYAGGVVTGALFAAAGGAACVVAVLAAGVFVGKAGTVAVGHGVLSGYAGTPAQMVRLAQHLRVGTRESRASAFSARAGIGFLAPLRTQARQRQRTTQPPIPASCSP